MANTRTREQQAYYNDFIRILADMIKTHHAKVIAQKEANAHD